ncbi:MAG: DUF169 domain-containing protein [Syntrophales bacterium]|nr:DUF169 domain-containing protein [Syntrophales bacterium]
MSGWKEKSDTLKERLRLRTEPVAYKRLEKAEDLDKIHGVKRLKNRNIVLFCQLPALARIRGWTVGATREDNMSARCQKIHGLDSTDEEYMKMEAAMLSRTWMPSPEEGMKQQRDYPRIPPGEAIVLSPLAQEKFEPDVVLIYGNPAQMMMILCAMQKVRYERFHFYFIGEGACADSLAECYVSGKPALALPCYGERSLGSVADDEMVLALPPKEIDRVITGLNKLQEAHEILTYPLATPNMTLDPEEFLREVYPNK